ncbi:MAG TPA: alpha/beta fold hydrolase, partial [Steroidobacteraceae bacterium]|nr:alpha/beta fold hydrolase [Steroidobacteraceae bacterium]
MPRERKDDRSPPASVRRMYVDCRYGQLHLRSAFPSNGGFDELTTLVCLDAGPATGRVFGGLLGRLGTDRSVYAPDLPGFGESDAVLAQPSIESHAMAVGDFIDHMRFRQLDLLGYEGGSFIAAALAAARPDRVRRVVMVAAPGFDAAGELPVVQQPVLMLRPQDGLRELAPRAREL